MISLSSREYFVQPDQFSLDIRIERLQMLGDEVEVKWRTISNNSLYQSRPNGSILFGKTTNQKIIKIDLRDFSKIQFDKIELFEPTNGYQIGENKIANISFVRKYLSF